MVDYLKNRAHSFKINVYIINNKKYEAQSFIKTITSVGESMFSFMQSKRPRSLQDPMLRHYSSFQRSPIKNREISIKLT